MTGTRLRAPRSALRRRSALAVAVLSPSLVVLAGCGHGDPPPLVYPPVTAKDMQGLAARLGQDSTYATATVGGEQNPRCRERVIDIVVPPSDEPRQVAGAMAGAFASNKADGGTVRAYTATAQAAAGAPFTAGQLVRTSSRCTGKPGDRITIQIGTAAHATTVATITMGLPSAGF